MKKYDEFFKSKNVGRIKLLEYEKLEALTLKDKLKLLSAASSLSERDKHQYLLVSILNDLIERIENES